MCISIHSCRRIYMNNDVFDKVEKKTKVKKEDVVDGIVGQQTEAARKANPFTIIANTIGGNYLPTSEQQSDNLKMQGYKSYETK